MIAKSNASRILRMAGKMEFWELNYVINHLLNVELPLAQKRVSDPKMQPASTPNSDPKMSPKTDPQMAPLTAE